MQLNSGVYIISYKNKNYVGSSVNLKKRLREHFFCLNKNIHSNKRLQNIYNKYGKEVFNVNIVAYCPPEYCIKLEQWFLDNIKNLLNHLKFAYSAKGRVTKKSTKLRISKKLKGKIVSDETKKLLSLSKVGKPHYVSDDTKRKMSESGKQKVFSKTHRENLRLAALNRSNKLSEKVKGENNPSSKLNWDIVKEIRNSDLAVKDLAIKYNVAKMTIYKIKNNKIWKEV